MKNILLINPDIPKTTRKIFEDLGINCLSIPRCPRLPKPVCAHPDMLFFKLSDGALLTEKLYFEENKEFFNSLPKGLKIISSDIKLSDKYPHDIPFDALKLENTVFCLEKYTAPEILKDSEKTVNIRQGYTKCSSLAIGNSVITADLSIHNALKENGFDSCLINPKGIALDGYACGFIGGASAVLENLKTVVFFGDISTHSSFGQISDFCDQKGYKLLYDRNLYPNDLGGALFLSI